MGLKNPVGTNVTWFGQPYTIIGVVNNMLIESPYDETRPIIYSLITDAGNMAIIRLNSSVSAKNAISKIETIFKKYNTDNLLNTIL